MKTIFFDKKPSIISTYSVVGPKESQSPLKKCFDLKLNNDKFNEKTYEKAERKMLYTAIKNLIKKEGLNESEIDLLILGDLLNQNISASFSAREFNVSYLGVYSACSSITESLIIGASMVNSNYVRKVISGTVSHFSTAERQYRYPLELGSTRPPQSQWTVTGAGTFLLGDKKGFPCISSATIGKVVDYGVTDANNMGAAMAPACAETIISHLKNTKTTVNDYDLIVSGDLGALGSRILKKLTLDNGVDISNNHVDAGELIYNIKEEEFQGGSGAGCSAVVMASYIYPKLCKKELKRVLFCATGALLSTVSTQQGDSIPSISHAVCIENF
ncbi:MAG: stage V sporulation protein AD [Clostridia bacterium]|nr:stage V sporulation protein AD [Clostridia bacterium]